MTKKIKWAAIQPLTGGMYLGAEKAIGHPAEFILSFKGIGDPKYDKDGNFKGCGNEYHLMTYLKKHNKAPNYKVFDRDMFDTDMSLDVQLKNSDLWTTNENIDFNDIDLVVGVPVCSGLSSATIGSDDTKNQKNCNMIWMAKYVLNIIQPKIYIFENAPGLFTGVGSHVRIELDRIAKESGYSISYCKTDTLLHNNCQRRPRTFVMFVKWRDGVEQTTPEINFENTHVMLDEMFARVLPESTQQFPIRERPLDTMFVKYFIKNGGEMWHTKLGKWPYKWICDNNKFDDLNAFVRNECTEFTEEEREKFIRTSEHCRKKFEAGLNYYSLFPMRPDDHINAVMFKMIEILRHPTLNRKLTVREYLTFMGHPQDFEMQGTDKMEYLGQIGQNVPVDTARWIVGEGVRIIENWDTLERVDGHNIMFIDNVKQTQKIA